MKYSRRNFITKSFQASALVPLGFKSFAVQPDSSVHMVSQGNKPGAYSINIFSKHLHWLNYEEMASHVAGMGFDGVDLTVRPEGHVLPERVTEDLPRAVEAIGKAGLKVHMITTGINDADNPVSEAILKTASSLGITHYRMGYFEYDEKISIGDNLKHIKTRCFSLAELNRTYRIRGDYQNHSGANFGAPVWDLWNVLSEINSPWIGSQYDILHATVEGANSWVIGLKLMQPFIGTLDIKDFQWYEKSGKWSMEYVPLGEGMVDFKKYFSLLKEYRITGPFSIHFEYPLGGAEHGAKVITASKEEVFASMKRDLTTLRKLIQEAGL